jgi:glycosyltransferase involved in cell wall biosynthesis
LKNKKKILYIAPLPPPINGQSKASQVLLNKISINNDIYLINLSKSTLKSGFISITRIVQITKVFFNIRKNRKDKDIIYLSLAESTLGNIRDLLIYLILFNYLDKVYIHMLGGAGMSNILNKKNLVKKINIFFFNKINGIIVEGEVNYNLFSKFISTKKIHIVPNFAEDFLFLNNDEIIYKFTNLNKIQILFLSNLINGKGYEELVDAYFCLNHEIKENVNIVFVGAFENKNKKNLFLSKISKSNNLSYIGEFIDGIPKRMLYSKSHIFCLPTYYPFEGQPISILESYAAGCVVITTNHSGIPYIFTHLKNGYMVNKKSVSAIIEAITFLVQNKDKMNSIALENRNYAFSTFRTELFENKIVSILNC